MKNIEFIQEKLEQLLGVGIHCEEAEAGQRKLYQENNPVYVSEKLQKRLIQGADRQERPFLYIDAHEVCFGAVRDRKNHYLIGPMSLQMMDRVELHRYYKEYGIEEKKEKQLKHFNISMVLGIVELIAKELTGQEYTDEELLYVNHIAEEADDPAEQQQVEFDLKEDDEALYHHTYYEERKLLDCVREGRVEQAVQYSKNMDVELGKLSGKELNHWKNVTVAAITLCTRAAIEGGLSPSVAYRLSDYYIQKSDASNDIAQVIDFRNRAVKDLAERVSKRAEGRRYSNYVEQCKDYVEKHYRDKIYLEDMAENLGISTSYLSKLFHRESGVRLQDYIVQVRVEHAANLLMYSDETIARIAEYVNFPSQSYFGRVFREARGMSPRKFREARKPSKF